MGDTFRVVVLSDLHAVVDPLEIRSPSLNYAQGSTARSLFQMCLSAIQQGVPDGVDLLLVAGDITDKASAGSLGLVWEDLNWLADQLQVPLVATSGNHDYDSRASDGPLPYESLFALEPPFPMRDPVARDMFFAQQFAVHRTDKAIVVTANSAAHHGYTVAGEPEHNHGRFSPTLPSRLSTAIESVGSIPDVRILLTHHHMSQLPSFDVEEKSSSIGYNELLTSLAEYGDWLVVHGHKHRGWIQYANGSGDSPPLFSSSSFSADFGGGSFAQKVRHQFHVIEFPAPESTVSLEVSGAHGTVLSWTHSRLGWTLAPTDSDMPGFSGFGWKANLHALASRIQHEVAMQSALSWDQLESFEPRLRYLTFPDLRRLVRKLDGGSPRVRTIFTSQGHVREMSIVGEDESGH